MNIICTGGCGFIGSHLVDRLVELGHRVSVIDDMSSGNYENLNQFAIFRKFDICDTQKLKVFFELEKPDIVFHLAAQINARKAVEDPLFDARTNLMGSINVLECAKNAGVKKIIFASTGGMMYGDADIIPTPETYLSCPTSPYGLNKQAIEQYLQYYKLVHNINFIALRFGNVYGPRQNEKSEAGVVAIFIKRMLQNKICHIYGDGRQTRDYVYVDDIVNSLIKAIDCNVSGAYNIGTEKETSVNYIFARLKKLLKYTNDPMFLDKKTGDHLRGCLDCHKAKKILKWNANIKFDDGLARTVEWFKSTNL